MHGGMNEELWLSHADDVRPQVDLQRRIWEELHGESEADTSDVSVWVEDFVARLSGSVSSYSARSAVEQAAERVRGVRAVVNELRVVLFAADCRPDNALAAAVANALEWDSRVPHVRLTVRVVDGWVALAGSVECQCQRVAAEETIGHLTGILGVTNAIVIEPPPTRADLQRLAQAALERVELHGSHVSLEMHERTAGLRGRVHSLAERHAAERAVWSVPGVASVDDLLTVR
jgi:osmotically-inducible protein OsmY